MAGRIAQFDVVIASSQGELLQLSSSSGVPTVYIDQGVFRHVFQPNLPCIRSGRVTIRISPAPAPIRAVPSPTGTIPPPARPINANESSSKMRRRSRHENEK